jgi:hypothetical protein
MTFPIVLHIEGLYFFCYAMACLLQPIEYAFILILFWSDIKGAVGKMAIGKDHEC